MSNGKTGSRLGLEVIVPRGIAPAEIHRISRPPQDLGWRHSPQARSLLPGGLMKLRRSHA